MINYQFLNGDYIWTVTRQYQNGRYRCVGVCPWIRERTYLILSDDQLKYYREYNRGGKNE